MSAALVQKIRKAREQVVTIDGHKYTIRRPTAGELGAMPRTGAFDLARTFTVDWDLTEIDLGVPGGTAERVPFDPFVWAEFISDRMDLWEPLAKPMHDAYLAHQALVSPGDDGVSAAQKN